MLSDLAGLKHAESFTLCFGCIVKKQDTFNTHLVLFLCEPPAYWKTSLGEEERILPSGREGTVIIQLKLPSVLETKEERQQGEFREKVV